MTPPRLILASASPRRRSLLSGIGLEAEVRPADIDETPVPGESPEALVRRLAAEKTRVGARPGEVVLAADTVVAVDGEILGKPVDDGEAKAMLRRLAERSHAVSTGVAVLDVDRDRQLSGVETTVVWIGPLSDTEIEWYVGTGEPDDKAGAYAIQGLGSLFVERIDGNYSNVVGLPIPLTYRLLRRAGFDVLPPRREADSG